MSHCYNSEDSASPCSMYRNWELVFLSISPQPALLILLLLILVSFRMKQLGQSKEPIKLVWDNDGPGVLL